MQNCRGLYTGVVIETFLRIIESFLYFVLVLYLVMKSFQPKRILPVTMFLKERKTNYGFLVCYQKFFSRKTKTAVIKESDSIILRKTA